LPFLQISNKNEVDGADVNILSNEYGKELL